MKRIKIAQIGIYHDHARLVMSAILANSDIFDFIGYCVEDSEEMEHEIPKLPEIVKKQFPNVPVLTLEEILNCKGLEAVVVESREKDLVKYATMAANIGLAVHMDKPGGEKLSDFEKLIDIVKAKKLVFSLGYMYRQNKSVTKLYYLIDKGELGEILYVETHMNTLHDTEKRRWMCNFKGGMMFFLGCHLIDIIYRIMGEPTEIMPLNTTTAMDGVNTEDYGFALFKYPTGISFAKTCDAEIGGFNRRQIVVAGTKGTVEIRPIEICDGCSKVGSKLYFTKAGENTQEIDYEPVERYAPMLLDFAQYIRGEKQNIYTPDYELSLYKLVLRACGVEI